MSTYAAQLSCACVIGPSSAGDGLRWIRVVLHLAFLCYVSQEKHQRLFAEASQSLEQMLSLFVTLALQSFSCSCRRKMHSYIAQLPFVFFLHPLELKFNPARHVVSISIGSIPAF